VKDDFKGLLSNHQIEIF